MLRDPTPTEIILLLILTILFAIAVKVYQIAEVVGR